MHTEPLLLQLGLSRVDFTPEVRGIGMLGWAQPHNVVEGVETRLHARALVVNDPATGRSLALVSLELCYVTTLLRRTVLARLQAEHPDVPVGDAELLLTATHTHSAPGGHSGRRFDNASVPGFQPDVLEAYVAGTVAAVAEAWRARQPGRLRVASGDFPDEVPVAFNRALRAHHCNPEVDHRYATDERHLAVEREMTVLRAEAVDGRPLGLVSWFGVHGTCVSSDNTKISADNKGYASLACEAARGEDFVALFVQGACGDVTPNHRRWPGRRFPGGLHPDDHESARAHGMLQARQALSLLDEAAEARALAGPLRVAVEHRDMGAVDIDADLVDGADRRTRPGAVGVRMLRGTWEGPGTPWPIGLLLHLATRAWQGWVRLRGGARQAWLTGHGNKAPLLSVGDGTVLGRPGAVHLVPPRFDPIVDHLSHQQDAVGTEPWLPQVLPLHMVVIDDFAILALPAEPTTQAGRRLRDDARGALSRALGAPVSRVQVTGYSDDYSGYVTTPEEYDRQDYEGAFTQFGRHTLPGWQTRARELAVALADDADVVGEGAGLPRDLPARRHGPRRWLLRT